MKSTIKILTGCVLAFGLSSSLSFASASQPNDHGSSDIRISTPSKITKNSIVTIQPRALLKWPRGSLIFPEINSPEKINEVFLLSEINTPYSERYSLYYHYGSQFFSGKKYAEAKKNYLKALALQADITAIHKRLGFLFMNSKDFKGAEAAYQKILDLDPGYTPAIAQLGICFAAQKKYSLAETHLKQAVQRDPSNVNYHLNLGNFYYYLKRDYRGARNSYKRALRLNPRLTKVQNNLRDIDQKFSHSKAQEDSFENSWGSDSVHGSSNESDPAASPPRNQDGANITSIWEGEISERPLF